MAIICVALAALVSAVNETVFSARWHRVADLTPQCCADDSDNDRRDTYAHHAGDLCHRQPGEGRCRTGRAERQPHVRHR